MIARLLAAAGAVAADAEGFGISVEALPTPALDTAPFGRTLLGQGPVNAPASGIGLRSQGEDQGEGKGEDGKLHRDRSKNLKKKLKEEGKSQLSKDEY